MLHELSGDRIQSLSRPLKANAGIVSVAFTSLEASWTADEVRCYRAQDFSPHYGMKQKHEYISLLGNLKYHETADFECCCIPLRLGDKSNVTGLGLFLVLMRPKIKGNIYGLQRALRPSTFHSVLDAFDNIETSERKILLPKMILPDEQLEGQPVDFVDHWTATKLLAEDDTFDEVTAGVRLGHFLHYSSISFDEDGVGFCYPRSVTGSSSDSSLRNVTHKGVPAEDNFSLRFDSPFMFLLVDRTHRIPFICGCYAGQPALSVERLRSTRPTSSVCNTNCAKFWNILATNISA
ncbi:unnamed protein product [Toxocara canis]|uniref:SERPIN domain-containing protein n=1 Tax=Toxocara canis TaxID=6265 RepID=A0A183TUW8_TOXCA|nr:unnamed protein product [Toxocara canis]